MPRYDREDLLPETLERAEREALERPEPCHMWDKRLYTTHGVVCAWAESSGDRLSESNYLRILEDLAALAIATGDEDQVIDAPIRDWAVGRLRNLFVQVRDDAGAYTEVFKEAVVISLALRDYSVYDEDDYNRREMEDFDEYVAERVTAEVAYHDTDETPVDETGAVDLTQLTHEKLIEVSPNMMPETPTDAEVAEAWVLARDAYYDWLATEHLSIQIEGQDALPL